jgi:hypothetical protein
MWETVIGKLLNWIPSPWSGVRLKHTINAKLCTDRHPMVFFVGGGPEPPEPPGPQHVDVSLDLWVPEHRTTVRDMIAEAVGQRLEPNIHIGFSPMTLEPGGKPEAQWIALGPPERDQLQAKAGDKIKVTLMLTRGRPRKLKATIKPE